MKPYRNHVEVPTDVDEAATWYEGREPGLGLQFVIAVEEAIAQIVDAPSSWARWPGTPPELAIHRFTMNRFPFVIGYIDRDTEVLILVVHHAKRRPLSWLRRARP